MCPRQGEARCTVIEFSGSPRRDRVARRTCGGRSWESSRHVIGHISAERRRALPRRLVATHAISGVQRVVVVDMAGSTRSRRRRHVRARQRKSRHAVVKRSCIPPLRRVAIRAIRQRKCRPPRRMHRIACLLPRCQMAARSSTRRCGNIQRIIPVNVT